MLYLIILIAIRSLITSKQFSELAGQTGNNNNVQQSENIKLELNQGSKDSKEQLNTKPKVASPQLNEIKKQEQAINTNLKNNQIVSKTKPMAAIAQLKQNIIDLNKMKSSTTQQSSAAAKELQTKSNTSQLKQNGIDLNKMQSKQEHLQLTGNPSSNTKSNTPQQSGAAVAELQQTKQPLTRIIYSEFPKNGTIVSITNSLDEKNIFVRELALNKRFEENLKQIETYSLKREDYQLTEIPKKGQMILARNEQLNNFSRALVTFEISDKMRIAVVYIDYGSIAVVNWTDCYHLNNELESMTVVTLPAQLKCTTSSLSSDKKKLICSYLTALRGNYLKIIYDETSSSPVKVVDFCQLTSQELVSENISLLESYGT